MNYSSPQRIPSVKRRYTGPYLPGPRSKRVALNCKQDKEAEKTAEKPTKEAESKADNANTDECIDFAVESPKKSSKEIESIVENIDTDNHIEVIESDDDVEEVQHNAVELIEQIDVDHNHPGIIEISNEDILHHSRSETLQNFVEIPDDPVLIDNSISNQDCVVELISISGGSREETSKPNTTSILKDWTCPNTPPKFLSSRMTVVLPNEHSPQVCLVQLKKINNLSKDQYCWKTYTVFGFQLRHFTVQLKDCMNLNPLSNTTPPFKTNNRLFIAKETGKQLSQGVSTPEFTEKYEDIVAEKLLSVKKRLHTPVKTSVKASQINTRPSYTSPSDTSPNVVDDISPEESTEKHPVHPRTRLRLSPQKSPVLLRKSSRLFSYIENGRDVVELSDSDSDSSSSILETETEDDAILMKMEDDDYVTLSGSQYENKTGEDNYSDNDDDGDDEYSILSNADDEMSDQSEQTIQVDNIKSEVKQEQEYVDPLCLVSDDDMDNLLDAYHQVKRQRISERQILSQPTFHTVPAPDIKPSLISNLPVLAITSSVGGGHLSKRQRSLNSTQVGVSPNTTKKSDKNKILVIKVVRLSTKTIQNLIEHCANVPDWHDNKMLESVGLSSFDINRLGIVTSSRQSSNYRLRQFVKRKKRFELNSQVEKPKPLCGKKNEKLNTKELKRLKRKMKRKEREERKQMEKDSIRRALLKINNRVMNQNRFWGFLNRGSSESCPIVL